MLPNSLFESFNVYMYGIMIALGILACFAMLYYYARLKSIPNKYVDFTFYCGVCSIIVGFMGAALWQGVFNYIDDMKKYGEATFSINGGITVIGGLVTGAACFIIISFICRKKVPFAVTRIIHIAPCCMTIAHAFGRLGCFFAGCCYGAEATGFFSFLGVSFQPGSPAYRVYGDTPLYPTQLFEAAFLFILSGILSYLYLKKDYKYNFVVYMVLYGIWRFLIEFVRADYRGSFVGGLTPSQTQSLVLVACSVPVYFLLKRFCAKFEAYKLEKQKALEQKLALEAASSGDEATAELKVSDCISGSETVTTDCQTLQSDNETVLNDNALQNEKNTSDDR